MSYLIINDEGVVIRDRRGAHLTAEWVDGEFQILIAPPGTNDGPAVVLSAGDRRRLLEYLRGAS